MARWLPLLLLAGAAHAYTDPAEVLKLLALRDEMMKPEHGIAYLLGSWKCPDDQNPTTCDPCGKHSGADDSWGYLGGGGGWEHIACRTLTMTPAEFGSSWHVGMNISRLGVVTTIHMTDLGIEGTLESLKDVYCPFTHLRELDLDGSHFTGGVPSWIADCFPYLSELDLSFGRFSGPLPDWVDRMGGHLNQFKVEHNAFSGPIPAAFSRMPKLRVLWLHHNNLSGNLPSDLGSSHALISFDARYNPKLCGPIPATLQVDWKWQWEHSAGIIQSWYGFCDKASEENSACGILVTQGTHVNRACSSVAQDVSSACSSTFDQCGGAPSPNYYKGKVVAYDTYRGPRCCESGSSCKFKTAYYSVCSPNDGSLSDHANDGATDLALLAKDSRVCANTGDTCGGGKGLYAGPTVCCSGGGINCVKLNYYTSLCLDKNTSAADSLSFGANLQAQQSVVAGWQAARTG